MEEEEIIEYTKWLQNFNKLYGLNNSTAEQLLNYYYKGKL